MRYTVCTKDVGGNVVTSQDVSGAKKAERIAKIHARICNNDQRVFIEFFRASDGQHGYLNRDGHGITGHAW